MVLYRNELIFNQIKLVLDTIQSGYKTKNPPLWGGFFYY